MTPALDLGLPEPERRRAVDLRGRWADLLYVPGPGFTSELDPGLYASSFVVVREAGPAVRITSLSVPAFGSELCRVRIEPLAAVRVDRLGSFFDPRRRGVVYAMAADRRGGTARPPDRPGWSYDGPPLADRLGSVARVRVVRERVSGTAAGRPVAWRADRGLAITFETSETALLLARPSDVEQAALIFPLGLYRALVDGGAPGPAVPGAGVADLLDRADLDPGLAMTVEIEAL